MPPAARQSRAGNAIKWLLNASEIWTEGFRSMCVLRIHLRFDCHACLLRLCALGVLPRSLQVKAEVVERAH